MIASSSADLVARSTSRSKMTHAPNKRTPRRAFPVLRVAILKELGVAETTVKTHLHRVFAKTGTSRQADLVRLVAGYASPLVR